MPENLKRLWRDYSLSIVLLGCFVVTRLLQGWTGWQKFAAEQLQHGQAPQWFGSDGYIWEFFAATFENWNRNSYSCSPWSCLRPPDSSRQRGVARRR